jgi:hypothetical protein
MICFWGDFFFVYERRLKLEMLRVLVLAETLQTREIGDGQIPDISNQDVGLQRT